VEWSPLAIKIKIKAWQGAVLAAMGWVGYRHDVTRPASAGTGVPPVDAPMPLRRLPGSSKLPVPPVLQSA
jgi:hypothetical protein